MPPSSGFSRAARIWFQPVWGTVSTWSGKRDHAAWKQAQAGMLSMFQAVIKKHLHPDTDAKQRFFCLDGFQDRRAQSPLFQPFHGVGESAHPG